MTELVGAEALTLGQKLRHWEQKLRHLGQKLRQLGQKLRRRAKASTVGQKLRRRGKNFGKFSRFEPVW